MYIRTALLFAALFLVAAGQRSVAQKIHFDTYQAQFDEVEVTTGPAGPYKRYQRRLELWKDHVSPDGYLYNFTSENWDAYRQLQSWTGPVSGNWQPVGPHRVYDPGDREGIGRVNCIAFESATVWYVGTAGGGLWRGEDAATWTPLDPTYPWTPLTDDLPVPSISGIVVHPADPNQIWILTGDGDGRDTPGVGILKSEDRGSTWNETSLVWDRTELNYGYKLLVHPTNPLIQYAATTAGLYRTTDGWVTMTQPYAANWVTDLEFKPGNPDSLYMAVTPGVGTSGAGVQVSGNGGVSFTDITGNMVAYANGGRIALAVTPADRNRLYVLVARPRAGGTGGGLESFQFSADGGGSFIQNTTNSFNILANDNPTGNSQGQGDYDLALWASPTAANTVLVGGVDVYKSVGGGLVWSLVADDNGDEPQYCHADIHAFETNPFNGKLYAGTDGGIYQSSDSGNSWFDMSNGLAITQYYNLNISSSFFGIIEITAGAQDNGTHINPGSSDLFTKTKGSDGFRGFRGLADGDPIRYVETQNGRIYIQHIWDTDDPSFTFEDEITPSPGNGVWNTPYQPNPNNYNHLVAGYERLYTSFDQGDSWNAMTSATAFPGGSNITEMDWSKGNTNYLAFIRDGIILNTCRTFLLHLSTNDLDACDCVAHSNFEITDTLDINISDVTHNTNDGKEVAVAMTGYFEGRKVYRNFNTDIDTNWQNITYNLPNVPILTIEWDVDGYYIGTDIGVFFLNHGDNVWLYHSENLPTVPVTQIEIIHSLFFGKRIFVGTYGRGVWVGEPAPPNRRTRWYVKESATGANDGTSWANAFTDLQDALNVAVQSDSIWVGVGTYKPTTTGLDVGDPASRQKSFHLNSPGVQILGGFFGTEDNVNDRLPDTWRATLSGDLGVAGDSTDNAYHVWTFNGRNEGVLLDGFIIEAGVANGTSVNRNGGGIYYSDVAINGGEPILRNLTIQDNSAVQGGGIYAEKTNNAGRLSAMYDVDFLDNASTAVGAAYYLDLSPGGVNGYSNLRIEDCQILRNKIASNGGAVHIIADDEADLDLEIVNSSISENVQLVAPRDGAAFYITLDDNGAADILLDNVDLDENFSVRDGAAILVDLGDGGELNLDLDQCNFDLNSAREGPAVFIRTDPSAATANIAVDGSTFTDNTATVGGVVRLETGLISSNMDVNNSSFNGNEGGSFGGGIHFASLDGQITIDSTTFSFNNSTSGGAFYWGSSSGGTANCTVTNSSFFFNSANSGGAIYGNASNFDLNLTADNNIFFSNTASVDGGAIELSRNLGDFAATISNSSFSNNQANSDGGSIYAEGVNLTVNQTTFTGDSSANNGASIYFFCGLGDTLCQFDFSDGSITGGGAFSGGAAYIRSFNGATLNANLNNLDLNNNDASSLGGALAFDINGEGSFVLDDLDLENNKASQGGAINSNANSDALHIDLTDSRFMGNSADNDGGAFHLAVNGSQTYDFRSVDFAGNTAGDDGGALEISTGGSDTIFINFWQTAFHDNSAADFGGAVSLIGGNNTVTRMLVSNSVLFGNSGSLGGSLYLDAAGSSADLKSTVDFITAYDNTASSLGGFAYAEGTSVSSPATVEILNSVLKSNQDSGVDPTKSAVYLTTTATGSASYSVFENGLPASVADGGNNQTGNPILAHPSDPAGANGFLRDSDDGLRLANGSIALDAANPLAPVQPDFTGLLRFSSPEAGAYEGSNPTCFTDVAPSNLTVQVSPPGALLSWEPIGNSLGCQVRGKPVGSPFTGTLNSIGLNASSTFVPASFMTAGTSYEWQVHCACSITPLDLTPLSVPDTFHWPGPILKEVGQQAEVNLFPNPTRDVALLLISNSGATITDQTVQWMLSNAVGQELQKGSVQLESQSAHVRLELTDFAAGTYIVTVQGTNWEFIEKLVVE